MNAKKVNIEEVQKIKKDLKKEKNKIYFALYNENEIIGYAILDIEKELILDDIFISEKNRSNEYGTFLLGYIINWVIDYGSDSIIVEKHKNMDNFLKKSGFIKEKDIFILKDLYKEKKYRTSIKKTSIFTFVVNILLTVGKILFGILFNLNSILADGLNSLSDSITNLLVLVGVSIGTAPEDKEHPYGHGKIESIFSIIIGTFMIVTSFEILRDSISKIIFKDYQKISDNKILLFVGLFIFISLKFLQYIYVKKNTKKYTNSLLKSLLVDYKSDILLSTSVLLGIIASYYINPIIDPIFACILSVYIMKEGYEIIKENTNILMETQDEELLGRIKTVLLKSDDIKNVHGLRMVVSGKNVFIYADVRMDKNLTVFESHTIVDDISVKIKNIFPEVKDIILHVDPEY